MGSTDFESGGDRGAPGSGSLGARPGWALGIAVLAFFVIGGLCFPSAGRDDKFLTFWPAHTLSENGAVLSYGMQRVEQSSSLFFVVALAGLQSLTGFAPPLAGWLLAILGGALTLVCAQRLAERLAPGAGNACALITATTGAWVYWSFGGAEPPWVGLLGLLFVAALGRLVSGGPRWSELVVFSAVTLAWLGVRPEAFLVALCATFGLALVCVLRERRFGSSSSALADRPQKARRAALIAFAIVLVASALLLGARELYFSSVLPQPVVAKSRGLGRRALIDGLRYLTRDLWLWPLLALGLGGALTTSLRALRKPTPNWTAVALALFLVAYLAFIALAGGDWMEASRFLAHAVPLLAVAACVALWSSKRLVRLGPGVTLALMLIGTASAVTISRSSSCGLPLWVALESSADTEEMGDTGDRYTWPERANLSHRRDMPVAEALDRILGRILDRNRRRLREQQGPATDASALRLLAQNTGFVVYHTMLRHGPHLRLYDHHGLSDRTITHSSIGNEVHRAQFGLMWKPEDYCAALERLGLELPDVVLFNAPNETRLAWVERFGLQVVYLRESPEELAASWAPGRERGSAQALAVRKEHVSALAGLSLPANEFAIE